MSSDSSVGAQNQIMVVGDTGVIKLGPNQILRLSAVSVDGELGGGIYGVRFRKIEFSQDTCSGGICKYAVASQTLSDVITLAPNEGIVFDDGTGPYTRVIVSSNSRNVRVTAMIINITTGKVDAFFDIWTENYEG